MTTHPPVPHKTNDFSKAKRTLMSQTLSLVVLATQLLTGPVGGPDVSVATQPHHKGFRSEVLLLLLE